MKKLLLVLALVAVYGIAISNVSTTVVSGEKAKVSIVDDNKEKADKKDVKKAEAKTEAGCTGTKEAAGCTESQKAACAEKGKACCGTAEKQATPKK